MGAIKTIISDFDKWLDISSCWINSTITITLELFVSGYNAAVRANDILASVPSDVGGSVYIGMKKQILMN